MVDVSATSTATQMLPVPNKKAMIVILPAATATGDEVDVSAAALGGFKTVDMAILFQDDGTAGIMICVIAGTVITFGTLTTGIHHMLVIGNAA